MLGAMIGREHRYESCRDAGCERPYCVIWREARAEGYDEGYADGQSAGFAAGMAAAQASDSS